MQLSELMSCVKTHSELMELFRRREFIVPRDCSIEVHVCDDEIGWWALGNTGDIFNAWQPLLPGETEPDLSQLVIVHEDGVAMFQL